MVDGLEKRYGATRAVDGVHFDVARGEIFAVDSVPMKRRGRGIACMWYPIGFTVDANPSAATVKVNEDGTATVLTGTVETLAKGSLTVLGQIAAEALGIATDDVHVVSADTDTTPMDTGAIASRTTYVTCIAIWLAAEAAKAILFETAAPMLGVKTSQLEVGDRKIQVKNYPQRAVAIGAVAHRAQVVLGQPAIGSASWNPPTVALDPETGQGKPFATYVYATQIAEIDVDDETGEVELLRIVAAHDCGTAINPMLVEGQVEGGISMGIGMALQEEMLFDADGRHVNPNLTNYIMPTSLDMPQIEVDIVQGFDPTGILYLKRGHPTSSRCRASASAGGVRARSRWRSIALHSKGRERVLLVGPSGAGKSTFLSLLCGIVTPSEGRLEVLGDGYVEAFRARRAIISAPSTSASSSRCSTCCRTARCSTTCCCR